MEKVKDKRQKPDGGPIARSRGVRPLAGVRGDLAKPTSGVPEVWPLGGAAKKGAAYGVRQPSHIGAWHHSAPPKMPAARIR